MDLKEALTAAFDEQTNAQEAPAPLETPADESPAPAPSPAANRDELGRFAPSADAPAPAAPATADSAPAEPAPPPPPTRNPFSSWKPEAQQALLKAERGEALSADELKLLRVEAERRESDFFKGIGEFKSHADRARQYDQVIAPYKQTLEQLGVDAPTAISALLRADHTLRTADPKTKAVYFQQLAREYGIDLNQQIDPIEAQTLTLQQQMAALREQQQMWQNQIQAQEQQKVMSEIEAFRAQAPHLDAVRDEMALLLETGKANSLQDAYDKAVWMRPDIRQSLIEQQKAQVAQQVQAQRAKAAQVSVKGSSPAAGGVQPTKGSLREQLEAAFNDIRS